MGRLKGGHNATERICCNCGKNEIVSRGLCNACYLRWQRYGNCDYRRKKKTNADKIRAMTDEELANFLRSHPWNAHGIVYADDELTDWLREEVKE